MRQGVCRRSAWHGRTSVRGKVERPMPHAARVEGGATVRASVLTGQILADGEGLPAGTTQDRMLLKPVSGPALRGVIGPRVVTRMARIVDTAAGKLDRDDIARAVVVGAARVRIHGYAPQGDGKGIVMQIYHKDSISGKRGQLYAASAAGFGSRVCHGGATAAAPTVQPKVGTCACW